MGSPVVLFVFNDPATQWKSLTGSSATAAPCTPLMGLVSDGNGDVSLNGVGTATPISYGGNTINCYASSGSTLVVGKGKTPNFSFLVVDGSSSSTAYFLCGLALKPIGASPSPGGNFPGLSVATATNGATTLTMADKGKAAGTWDFWVLAQNAGRDLGLIDPLITNNDQ